MSRKRGSRFRKVIDALEQLEGIEHVQQAYRKGRSKKRVERKDKSERRLQNSLDRLKTPQDTRGEFG